MSGTAPVRGAVPVEPDVIEAVVVPLDRSQFSLRAIGVACRLADRFEADIHLFTAVETEDEVPATEAELAAVDVGGRRLHRTVVVNRDPAGAIHEELRRLRNAVACMASHGRGRSAAVIGSVANEVIARGHDPLVVVGPLVDAGQLGQGIVACVDERPAYASNVADAAWHWARLLTEPLTVICVAEPVPPPVTAGPPRRRFGPDEDVDLYLRSVVRRLEFEGDAVQTRAVYDPVSPADGVASYLAAHPAFLAVTGTHARLGLTRLVTGSVAAAIVRRSTSPVLVVPLFDHAG